MSWCSDFSNGEEASIETVSTQTPQQQEMMQKMMSGKDILFESVHRRKDGSLFPVEIHDGISELAELQDSQPLSPRIGKLLCNCRSHVAPYCFFAVLFLTVGPPAFLSFET